MNVLKRNPTRMLLLYAAFAVFGGGCSDPGKDVTHYVMTGKIVEIDKADKALEVDMDAVPGYMEAMVMSVHVKDVSELDALQRGESIRADLVVHPDGSWIQDVQVVAKSK